MPILDTFFNVAENPIYELYCNLNIAVSTITTTYEILGQDGSSRHLFDELMKAAEFLHHLSLVDTCQPILLACTYVPSRPNYLASGMSGIYTTTDDRLG